MARKVSKKRWAASAAIGAGISLGVLAIGLIIAKYLLIAALAVAGISTVLLIVDVLFNTIFLNLWGLVVAAIIMFWIALLLIWLAGTLTGKR